MIVVEIAGTVGDIQGVDPHPMLVLWGFSVAESASSASTAEIVIRPGTTANDPMICAPINFAADGYGPPAFFPHPVQCPKGIFVDRVSGSTTVVLYVDYQ